MKHLITFLTLAILSLTASATTPDTFTYTANIGTRYELHADTVVPVPMQCAISLSDTGAALSFRDNTGRHVYTAGKAIRVSNNAWVFSGFACYLPDGTRGRILSAGLDDDGVLTVVFQPISDRLSRLYCFVQE